MLNNSIKTHITLALSAVALMACNKVPDNVIQPDEMAELMADIHTAESVVEMNYGSYATDSAREELKQAILQKHGVTQADLDTSFMWYGSHLDKYMDIYDEVNEILQRRLDHNQALETAQASLSVSGDSVDVWAMPRRYIYTDRLPAKYMTFKLEADTNWVSGDSYTWRVKLFNSVNTAKWGIVASYADGSVEVLNEQFSGSGWQQLKFQTDSTRKAVGVRGYLELTAPSNATATYVDSVQLVRNRLNSQTYNQRYRQRLYDLSKK
jgi:hypothetical protein